MQKHTATLSAFLMVATVVGWCSLFSNAVLAHCDSLGGPVIKDAKLALEKGDPAPVLKWVMAEHENEIRDVFKQTMTVRSKGDDARALADQYFFETLVRIHRAGEGEGFTGLKPAGEVDSGIAAADSALQTGSADVLIKQVSTAVSEAIQKRFSLAQARKKHAGDSTKAGREYVEAYVDYIHFVEEVNRIASHGAVSHMHHDSILERE